MKKWIIYFTQVNQEAIEVEANTKDEARTMAMKEWRLNIYPDYEIQEIPKEAKKN